MNKSKTVVFALLALSIAQLDAGIKTNNGPSTGASKRKTKTIAIKHETGDQADTGMMELQPPKTLEEQHLVFPLGTRQKKAQIAFCLSVKNTVHNELMSLVEKSGGNLVKGIPNVTKGPSILTFQDSETKEFIKIYYTPKKPVKVINNKEEFINEIHELFKKLADNFKDCGLTLKKIAGGTRIQEEGERLAWYELNPEVIGGPKMYLILKNITPSITQVEAYEAGIIEK